MSRSGYTDDCDGWDLIRWRGAVTSAIRGKRGQAFLREMLTALDALPEPRLIAEELITEEGCCAIGAVFQKRGTDIEGVDPYDRESVATLAGISPALVAELSYENDEGTYETESPERRFLRMRAWAVAHLEEDKSR